MNRPTAFVVAATCALLLTLTAGKCDGGGLEGRWKIVSVPEGWKKVPGTNVVISASEIRICVGRISAAVLTYTANSATGKVEAIRKVKGKTVVQRGVYRQSGDMLMVSVGAEGKPAPASADSSGSGAMRWVFRRAG
ncbi:MAG TPA: hypothetical protein VG796_04000 [Verrucomicrobiales bacterium]|jgi:hypothetical protein|nr:hypothetical protein [Verrucomicrobiales bacterium]